MPGDLINNQKVRAEALRRFRPGLAAVGGPEGPAAALVVCGEAQPSPERRQRRPTLLFTEDWAQTARSR